MCSTVRSRVRQQLRKGEATLPLRPELETVLKTILSSTYHNLDSPLCYVLTGAPGIGKTLVGVKNG